jgi:hypothetical protein
MDPSTMQQQVEGNLNANDPMQAPPPAPTGPVRGAVNPELSSLLAQLPPEVQDQLLAMLKQQMGAMGNGAPPPSPGM